MKTVPEDYYAALIRQRNEALDRLANTEAELAAAGRAVAELTDRLEVLHRQIEASAPKDTPGCCGGTRYIE